MFCRNCGAELPNDSSFCPKCGKETALAPTATVDPVPTATTDSTVDSGVYFSSGTAAAKRPISKKALFITLAAVVGVVVIGLAAFFIWRNTTVNQFNIPLGAMYNSKLNIGIRLGDSQEDIEKKLGVPILLDNGGFFYSGDILVYFTDDAATSYSTYIYSDDIFKNWKVNGEIALGSSSKDVLSAWGEPSQTNGNPSSYTYIYLYFYDSNGLQTKEPNEICTTILFCFDNDTVSTITCSNSIN